MKTKYTASCDKKELQKIRAFVDSRLSALNLTTLDRNAIILAIDEACANAIIHGNNCNITCQIDIEIEINDKSIKVLISDIGDLSFLDSKQIMKDVKALANEKRKGGMGLSLIHNIMDDVEFFQRDQRNYCAMTKHFAAQMS